MDNPVVTVQLNWLSIFVAALAGFVVGGLWYGPLFGNAWRRASGVTTGTHSGAQMARLFGTVLVLNLIAAYSLAMFIGPAASWRFGLFAGFMTGLTFVATALGVIYLFEARPLRLWLVNAGYQIVIFSVMGVILGAWH